MSDADWLTEAGARELARRITSYWLQRGCTPIVKAMPMLVALNAGDDSVNDRHRVWVVRSDIGGELPKQNLKSTAA